jgi:hypothetical protein
MYVKQRTYLNTAPQCHLGVVSASSISVFDVWIPGLSQAKKAITGEDDKDDIIIIIVVVVACAGPTSVIDLWHYWYWMKPQLNAGTCWVSNETPNIPQKGDLQFYMS